MRADTKLWGEYLDYIDDQNEEGRRKYLNAVRRLRKQREKKLQEDREQLEKIQKAEHKRALKAKKLYEQYDALPWYKKLFTTEPPYPYYRSYVPAIDEYFLQPMFIAEPFVLQHPTMEGFMTWKMENNK